MRSVRRASGYVLTLVLYRKRGSSEEDGGNAVLLRAFDTAV